MPATYPWLFYPLPPLYILLQSYTLHFLFDISTNKRSSHSSVLPPPSLPWVQSLPYHYPPHCHYHSYRVYVSFCPKEQGVFYRLECYDPSHNTWSHVGPIPDIIENHVLKDFAMVSPEESVYIIGARVYNKRKLCTSGECNDFVDCSVDVSPMVLRCNVRSGQWSKCAPLGIPRYEFACTVCGNKIYVAGGKSDLASGKGISSAETYDPAVDMWTPLPNISTMRHKCVGVTWQGKIHVVGRLEERKESDPMITFMKERSSAEAFNILAGKWELAVGMWQLHVPPNQIVEMDRRLFSSSDCLRAWKGHVEVYDGKLNMWDEVECSRCQILNPPISDSSDTENWAKMQGMCLTMAPIGTQLYFLAGQVSRTVSTACIYDTVATSDAWRSFEPMEKDGEKELCSHCCVVKLS